MRISPLQPLLTWFRQWEVLEGDCCQAGEGGRGAPSGLVSIPAVVVLHPGRGSWFHPPGVSPTVAEPASPPSPERNLVPSAGSQLRGTPPPSSQILVNPTSSLCPPSPRDDSCVHLWCPPWQCLRLLLCLFSPPRPGLKCLYIKFSL